MRSPFALASSLALVAASLSAPLSALAATGDQSVPTHSPAARAPKRAIAQIAAEALTGRTLPAETIWQGLESKAYPGVASDFPVDPGFSRVLFLDRGKTAGLLSGAAKRGADETGADSVILPLPMPNGTFSRFRVEESSVMSPEFAAEHPGIKTYIGYGIDDPTATMCCDLSSAGFRAMILSSSGSYFIDPYRLQDADTYICYDKRGFRGRNSGFSCGTNSTVESVSDEDGGQRPDADESETPVSKTAQANVSNGTTYKVYRLSVAVTAQYSAYQATNTLGGAAEAIVQTVNRVNLVYGRDLAISLTLVPNPFLFSAEPDGFTNGNANAMLAENQAKHNAQNLGAFYDIGHVFGTDSGGLATLGCVCKAASKAQGVTGSHDPIGDPFDIDYVCHEIGHQFGADHTFDATTGACGGGNRVASSAFEPGSGSTIMAYANICAPNNVQNFSNDYFHTRSFDQIVAYTTTGAGNTPFLSVASLNSPPAVNAGADVTIPRGTPFTLTATGSDANSDALTYCWEQFDLGTTPATMPLFRSRAATAGASRDFPNVADLSGGATPWETLPSVDRTMNFRCTARDPKGGVSSDAVKVTVKGSPFSVVTPATGAMWVPGTTQTITWTVENPKLTGSVQIWLWNGSGWVSLKPSTPNDGSENILVPNTTSGACRVLIASVGSIFFDLSDGNFTITAPAVFSETVETNAPGWLVSGSGSPWQIETTASAHSGSKRFTLGAPSYANNTSSTLISPVFSLAGKSSASLTYFFLHDTETTYDKFWVEVTKNNGETWTKVGPTRTGTSAGWPNWTSTTVSLTPFVGSSVCKLRFRFTSDANVTAWGAAVDDIVVTAQ